MIFITIIVLIITMSISPATVEFVKPDIIPCKDGYQIVYDNGDGTYDEYFVCDIDAINEINN